MENQNKYIIDKSSNEFKKSEKIYKMNVAKNKAREEKHKSNQKILEQIDNINIKNVWENYIKDLKNNQRYNKASILEYSEIILIDNNLLVKASNLVQAKEIQHDKHLIEYLKNYTGIKNLKIIAKVEEQYFI